MRTLSPKAFALAIAALFLGGALAGTPAFAMISHPGGGGGGFYHGAPGGSHRFNGAPSSGGVLSHPNLAPTANFAARANHVPYASSSWSTSGKRHYRFWRRHRYGWWGGGGVYPWPCDEYSCDNSYDYDDSDCWRLQRIYNRYGRFVGWRRVYVCETGP
jgi:hypothetical protein